MTDFLNDVQAFVQRWNAIIAVVGRRINRYSVKTQKRNFRNQLIDRARMEIARLIHKYQQSVTELLSFYKVFLEPRST